MNAKDWVEAAVFVVSLYIGLRIAKLEAAIEKRFGAFDVRMMKLWDRCRDTFMEKPRAPRHRSEDTDA